MIFAHTIHLLIDSKNDIINIFQQPSVFRLDDYINFENPAPHKYIVKTVIYCKNGKYLNG